jgi:hypothetical protein
MGSERGASPIARNNKEMITPVVYELLESSDGMASVSSP